MMARMQKQTTRAQHRTNIRERYGLQPDMLDTGTCGHYFLIYLLQLAIITPIKSVRTWIKNTDEQLK